MKALIAALLLAPCIALASAQPVSLNFNAVPLVQFGQAMFNGMMKRDFVVSPDVIGIDKRITINVKNIDTTDLPQFVERLLLREGIVTTLKDGIYYLSLSHQVAGESQHVPLANAGDSPYSKPAVDGRAQLKPGAIPDSASLLDSTAAPSQMVRASDDESEVFEPLHRGSEFIAGILTAGFGSRAAINANGRVVLTGSVKVLAKMKALCVQLDTPTKMIDVSASWIEVTHSNGQGRGISLAAKVLGVKLGATIGSVNSSNAISLKNARFEMVIDALNTDSRFRQVSNSRIAGEDHERLNLTVGDETPTVGSSGNDTAGNPVQNIVYRPSGVIINVLPRLLGDGHIKMDLDAQISSFKATSNGVAGSPTLIKRQVTTKVKLSDGDVILLGGLEDSQTTESISTLPFLPSWWQTKSKGGTKTDLVLVVSARVLK